MHAVADGPERWIWMELIGFDNRREDLGAAEYLDNAGFVPDAICLLLSSIDFILLHDDMATEKLLPADICSREGHDHNQDRQRQPWTIHQVRRLIAVLQGHGIAVYATVFAGCFGNRYHREWVTDHPEVQTLYAHRGVRGGLNPLARMRDGSWFEDFFIDRLERVLVDYGFDGWHGADGYGPLSGPLYEVDFSDNMIAQFAAFLGERLPADVTRSCDAHLEAAPVRADWIWRNRRREWTDFYAGRWAGFWGKVVRRLHAVGKKAVVNSAWGRAPFESLYRYGVDYHRIAEAGVDAIVVETVAAALTLDPRCGDPERHFDFLSMLLLIKAYVPRTTLIFLHNTHDIVEQWDVLRHHSAVLEKEIYSLHNVYLRTAETQPLEPCAAGFLVCLGDGIQPHEWQWLQKRWEWSASSGPVEIFGPCLVWSDAVMHAQREDFSRHRTWFLHRTLFQLMSRGAPVHHAVRIEDLEAASGPLLVIDPHLLPSEERERLLAYDRGAVFWIGPDRPGFPAANTGAGDGTGAPSFRCFVSGSGAASGTDIRDEAGEESAEDPAAIPDPAGYWDYFPARGASSVFLAACARLIVENACGVRVLSERERVAVMARREASGTVRLAVKNKTPVYAKPEIDVGETIDEIRVVGDFPLVALGATGSRFSLKIPPNGISVVDIVCAPPARS